MVKVYFGPKKHCPADELPADERFLWLRDFHLLRGFERDFWTNNPLILDAFEPQQILVWSPAGWRPLSVAAEEVLPGWVDQGALGSVRNGLAAILCEARLELLRAQAVADSKQQP